MLGGVRVRAIKVFIIVAIALTCQCLSGQGITDVKIGDQVWTSKNLDVFSFANGDPIPEAKTRQEWNSASDNHRPAWCNYDNDTASGHKYGKLYNWYAVHDPRGLAPKGWHVPSDAEWKILVDHLGGVTKAGAAMKFTSGWSRRGNGNNSSGFAGIPGGDRDASNNGIGGGFFGYAKTHAFWWTSTQTSVNSAWYYTLFQDGLVRRYFGAKGVGYSVRCVKD